MPMLSNFIAKGLIIIFMLVLLCNCASQKSMDGSYRGPERFGKEEYNTAPPSVQLSKKVRVVLLTMLDERTKRPELDWTRQANIHADSVGQPPEVRPEIEKAITNGLKKHPHITLISPATFMKSREADLIISGRVIKCDAERGARVFGAQTVLEFTARDEFGNAFWKTPLRIQAIGKSPYRDTGYFDEIEPGKVGTALTESIESAANEFLQKAWLKSALTRAQAGPNRELATQDVDARAYSTASE